MYIDHINTFDNKQDADCVVSLIEDILNSIKRILPDITMVILQSDNAILYQNEIVPFLIHMFSISTGLFVSHYIRTYIGSGKGMIYGHFTTMMKILHA